MNQPEEKPPFFKKWSGLYWTLTLFILFLILFFYYLTQSLS